MRKPETERRPPPASMATGGKPSDYQVLLELKEELVDRIISSGTDVEVLTTKAVAKGLIPQQSLTAINSSTTARSGKERAEQFVARVLEAIRGNPLGERTTLFLQVLDDLSLSSLSGFIRSKLAETRRDTSHDPSPSSLAHRPGPSQQPRGGAYGGQPKLEPADNEDSGVVTEGVTNDNANSNANSSVEVVPNPQHKMAPAKIGGAGFKPLSNGVIVVQPEHAANLAVSPDDDPPSIPETQPHTYTQISSSNPMITGVTAAPPVLPAVAQIEQDNQELKDRVAKMASHEESLQSELSQLKVEKEKSEQELEEKGRELERVKSEKDAQIQSLKAEIKEKEEKMEELQRKLSQQEQQNEALKEHYEAEIAKLKEQLESMEKKYHAETLQLTKEKHDLELKVERMRTQEEFMKRQISEEKQESAELKAKVAEEKQKNTELKTQQELKDIQQQHQEEVDALKEQQDALKQRHRDSMSENKKLKEELAEFKRQRDKKPDTS